jgi:hypothetical protein
LKQDLSLLNLFKNIIIIIIIIPNWRTLIFQRGRYTTNQLLLLK